MRRKKKQQLANQHREDAERQLKYNKPAEEWDQCVIEAIILDQDIKRQSIIGMLSDPHHVKKQMESRLFYCLKNSVEYKPKDSASS